jgi:hypothetical protein
VVVDEPPLPAEPADRDYRKFRVWDRTMLLKELSYAAPQTAFYPG